MSTDASVLLVTQVFPPAVGGSGALLENIYSRLRRDVHVLTDAQSCPGADARRGPLQITRTALDGTRWGIRDGGLRQHMRVARTIRQLSSPGTIVHCGRAQPEGVAALIASKGNHGRRFLIWAHGEEITTAETSRELRWVMQRVYAGAAGAIANSRHTAAMLERAGMPRSRVDVVYPGVDADRFHPDIDSRPVRQRYAPGDELLFVTVGRLQARKGHDLAIEALASLRDRLPPFRYVIAGGGDDRPRLEQLSRECGIADAVSFAGEVPSSELPQYFAAADVFLHPNRVVDAFDFEGFGLVFLEAAAAGTPVIGGATGGVVEAVQDGVTGLLVSGTDVAELAATIQRLVSSVELRRRLGSAGRDRVTRCFTWDAAARAVERIHERLIASVSL